jgi:CRISPR-associated protein Cas2
MKRISGWNTPDWYINMFILITYDVNTETAAGKKRLRHVAKECVNYGHRVQNSVFECEMDPALYRKVKEILLDIIDPDKDSLRFYHLGNNYKSKIEHFGVHGDFDVHDAMIL